MYLQRVYKAKIINKIKFVYSKNKIKTMKVRIVKKVWCIILLNSVLLNSCANVDNRYDSVMTEEIEIESKKSTINNNGIENRVGNEDQSTIKIIRDASCRIKVKDIDVSLHKIKKIVEVYKGYIANEEYVQEEYIKENKIIIRIPQLMFDKALDSINKISTFIENRTIKTKDVTEEYVDIEARLKTKIEVKNRYETILRTKAETVEDLLKTESKLNELQSTIEEIQGRQRYLNSKISYSTISIDLYEEVNLRDELEKNKPTFLMKIKEGIVFGWSFLAMLCIGVFYIWPLLILIIILIVYLKRRKKN